MRGRCSDGEDIGVVGGSICRNWSKVDIYIYIGTGCLRRRVGDVVGREEKGE